MTLVAFSVTPDRAEVMTDRLGYTATGRHMDTTTRKAWTPPGAGLAVTYTGECEVFEWWRQLAYAAAADHDAGADSLAWWRKSAPPEASAFDLLDLLAQNRLPDIWRTVVERRAHTVSRTVVMHVGWSGRLGRFAARGYSSETGFRSTPLNAGCYVTPDPYRLSDPEAVEGTDLLNELVCLPHRPASDAEWADLAKQAHAERALAFAGTGAKVFIGGAVTLTTLRADGTAQERTIHRFDDTGAQFRKMVKATAHPAGQLAACVCGSGRMFVDCHALPAEAACPCGTGRPFGDCCRLDPASREARDYLREHPELTVDHPPTPPVKAGRNEPCPCGSGSKFKKCCALIRTAV